MRQDQFLDVIDRDEAERRFQAVLDLRPLGEEVVPLDLLLERVLARDVVAPVDVPSFDRSNVDGFAVRAEDVYGCSEEEPARLTVVCDALVPGRGEALIGADTVAEGIALTAEFLRDLYQPVQRGVARGASLKECFDTATEAMRPKYGTWPIFEHCQPFNVARAYDEAQGIDTPRIWTAERDRAMWAALQGT